MSPEMINVIGGLLIAVVTAVLTFVFTVLLNKRKVLEYNVFSMPLLRFTPKKERTLNVSVDKSLLTGKQEDQGFEVAVSNAYGFEIEVMNIGNDDITNASITVRLHESAKIIECETNPPAQTGYEVSIESDKGSLNARRVIVPYINRRERFLVRLMKRARN